MQNIPVEIDDNNMLCGRMYWEKFIPKVTRCLIIKFTIILELPYKDFPCNIGTPAYRAKHFTSDTRPSSVDFRVEFGPLTMEFVKDEVLFFAAYNKTDGARAEFRGEYISLKYFPITQIYADQGSVDLITAFNRTSFTSFVWETPQKLRVNMTETSNVTFEYIWEFDYARKLSNAFAVKFSFVVYSTCPWLSFVFPGVFGPLACCGFSDAGHVWLPTGGGIDQATVNINLVLNYKIQHSPVNGPPVKCSPTNVLLAECYSPIASFFTQFDLRNSETIVGVETQRTRMGLAFPLSGKLDGRILSGIASNFQVFSGRYPWPLPSGLFLESYANVGIVPNFTNIPIEEQTYIFPLQLVVPIILRRLDYDPDVSITLLFDPNAVPSASFAPDIAEISSSTTIIIIIVVVIVAGIIAIAGVAIFAKIVFPYAHTIGAKPLRLYRSFIRFSYVFVFLIRRYLKGRREGNTETQLEDMDDPDINSDNTDASGRASRPQTWNSSVMPTMK